MRYAPNLNPVGVAAHPTFRGARAQFAALALAAFLVITPSLAAEPPGKVSCEAAAAILPAYIAKLQEPAVFGDASPFVSDSVFSPAVISTGWTGATPHTDTLRLVYNPQGSVVACKSVRRLLRAKRIAISNGEHVTQRGAWVHDLSAPLINNAQGEGLILVHVHQAEGLGSSARLLLLRAEKGAWRVVSVRELSLS